METSSNKRSIKELGRTALLWLTATYAVMAAVVVLLGDTAGHFGLAISVIVLTAMVRPTWDNRRAVVAVAVLGAVAFLVGIGLTPQLSEEAPVMVSGQARLGLILASFGYISFVVAVLGRFGSGQTRPTPAQ